MSADEVNGKGALSVARGLGIAMTMILDSQVYPFMLSSAFTARTIVQEKDQVPEVQKDLNWAFAITLVASAIIAYFIKHDWWVLIIGAVFSFALYEIYLIRGNIPFNITAW
jgi:hypothetical protein